MKQTTDKVWERFADRLRRFIISKVKDKALADDLLQETFIRIHSKIDSLQDETKVQSWVYQIARHIIYDHFRKSSPETNAEVAEVMEEEQEVQEAMATTIRDMVLLMEELPEQDCQALCRVEFEGISIREYAETAGISYTAAKSRVARARYKLSDLLMNCCHYEFDKIRHGDQLSSHQMLLLQQQLNKPIATILL